jgi:hypothetical protein
MEYSQIILELMARIQTLEKEVAELKKNTVSSLQSAQATTETNHYIQACVSRPIPEGKRDTTRYMFENNVYLKNRLVLAVIHAYVRDNPNITREELKTVFPKSLQGSIGVVEFAETARLRSDYTVRFFTKEEEVVHLDDGDMYVCTQWGILNISNVIKCATQLDYKIEAI